MKEHNLKRVYKSEDLTKHLFLSAVVDKCRPVLVETFKAANVKMSVGSRGGIVFEPKEMPDLTDEQLYNRDVLHRISTLISAVERLEEIRFYLFEGYYEKLGITEDKWIHYHFSNHVITVVAIYDTALLLVNAVFMLGLKPRDCNNNTVKNNLWVRRTRVRSALNRIDEVTKHYRQSRNLFLHRSEMPRIEDLQMLEMLNLIRQAGEPLLESAELSKGVDEFYSSMRLRLMGEFLDKTSIISGTCSDPLELDNYDSSSRISPRKGKHHVKASNVYTRVQGPGGTGRVERSQGQGRNLS